MSPKFTEDELDRVYSILTKDCNSMILISDFHEFGSILGCRALDCKSKEQLPPQKRIEMVRAVTEMIQKIPGLGPKGTKKLVQHFGSLYNIVNADKEELRQVLDQKLASSILKFVN